MILVWLLLLSSISPVSLEQTEPEAISLLGEPLYSPALEPERSAILLHNLQKARSKFESNPQDLENIIWLGRRTAYLGRFQEAIQIYSRGLEIFPENPRLLRHRGHRYISIRRLESAVSDLRLAAEKVKDQPDLIEADGAPNPAGIPRSTLHFNILYHLGLAHYLLGDFDAAETVYRACLDVSQNDDLLVATTHWLYMTLRRQEKDREAALALKPIEQEMEIMENHSYHRLLRMYQGFFSPEEVFHSSLTGIDLPTTGYGVGNWYFFNQREEEAKIIFEKILNSKQWAAFGYIAAESELARLRKGQRPQEREME